LTNPSISGRLIGGATSPPTRHEESATRAQPLVRVDQLHAGYDRPVVGPLSFEVAQGDVVGVRGPNGVGKSTLLRAIVGAARIFAGQVVLQPGVRIAYQQQSTLPLNHVPLSGRELLALTGADPNGLPPWISPLIGRRLDRLSGGQLQFLQIWACLKAPVSLILLDEPTNNVDPPGVRFLEEEIARLRADHALMVVSHDNAFLDAICTRSLQLG